MSKKSAYFTDDYFRTGQIKETTQTPEVNFKYKPLGITKRTQIDSVFDNPNSSEKELLEAAKDVITSSVISWDLKKPDGSPVAYDNLDELERIDPYIIQKMTAQILEPPKELTEQIKN